MAILVRVPVPILEDLVEAAISKQGNIYRAELAKLIGASKESLDFACKYERPSMFIRELE